MMLPFVSRIAAVAALNHQVIGASAIIQSYVVTLTAPEIVVYATHVHFKSVPPLICILGRERYWPAIKP